MMRSNDDEDVCCDPFDPDRPGTGTAARLQHEHSATLCGWALGVTLYYLFVWYLNELYIPTRITTTREPKDDEMLWGKK